MAREYTSYGPSTKEPGLNPRTSYSTRPVATWKSSPTLSRVTKRHLGRQRHSTGSPARSRVPRRIQSSSPMTMSSVSPVGGVTNENSRLSGDSTFGTRIRVHKSGRSNFRTQVDESPTPGTAVSPASPPPSSPQGSQAVQGGEPVLLMLQEFQNGESWFIQTDNDTDQLLPYLLLNAGFEVWIGSQQATYYGHDHITLTPDNQAWTQSYWNWTWDEHAKYDMPALLELVYSESGSVVNFVGISQVLGEYTQQFGNSWQRQTTDKTEAWPYLTAPIQRYQNPSEAHKLLKIQRDLDETKVILHKTIDSELARGDKLDTLVDKSTDLSAASQLFCKQAKKTNQCCSTL